MSPRSRQDPSAGLPERGVGAHRGGGARRPENTLAAFREALRLGVHQLELDVRRSADGALVVIHDAHVDRTTDGTGAVASLPLARLRELDAGARFAADFAGERIPTLAEALDAAPRDVWLNLEIKRGEPIAREVAELVGERDRSRQTVLACGNAAGREARAVDPRLRLCNLARQRSRAAYLDHALALGADFLQLHHLRGPPEPELVARAHAEGLRVNFVASPDGPDVAGALAAGVDFVLVDDVPAGLAAARRAGIPPR